MSASSRAAAFAFARELINADFRQCLKDAGHRSEMIVVVVEHDATEIEIDRRVRGWTCRQCSPSRIPPGLTAGTCA